MPLLYTAASPGTATWADNEDLTVGGVATDDNAAGATNDATIATGNAGAGDSGDINLVTGTATGTRGSLSFSAYSFFNESEPLSPLGDPRGLNANDLQAYRTASTQVASGIASAILWGTQNTAAGYLSCAGGTENYANGAGVVLGGSQSYANDGMALNSWSAQALGWYSVILGGLTPYTAGRYSVVLGGYYNRTTSAGSVAMGSYTLADLDGKLAIGGRYEAPNGGGQTEVVNVAGTTTGDQTNFLTSYGNEVLVPTNGTLAVFGRLIAWNTTDNATSVWNVDVLCKNIGGVASIINQVPAAGAQVANFTDDGGAHTLAVSASGNRLRFSCHGVTEGKTLYWSGALFCSRSNS